MNILKRIINFIWTRYLFLPFRNYAIDRIREVKSPDFEFADIFMFGLNRPSQIKYEIIELLKIVKAEKPKIIMEIGTAKGGTLFLFSKIAEVISIDKPFGSFGYGYTSIRISLYNAFGKVHLIRADSHLSDTFLKVLNVLNNRKIDFLFIDGDHTEEGVKKDFKQYSKLVRKGGLIALHDIAETKDKRVGVHRLWKELKKEHNTTEIIEDDNQGWAGIGVIRK